MAEFKQVDLRIGNETQFNTNKSSLPEGTLVGITDPITENDLSSDLQKKVNNGGNFVLLETITISDETTNNINRSFNPKLKKAIVEVSVPNGSWTTIAVYTTYYCGTTYITSYSGTLSPHATYAKRFSSFADTDNNIFGVLTVAPSLVYPAGTIEGGIQDASAVTKNATVSLVEQGIDRIYLYLASSTTYFPSGTIIKIYGVRA